MWLFGILLSTASAQDLFLSHRTSAPRKPHLLLVLADDLGYGNVGWLRQSFGLKTDEQQTPEMDQLVAEGMSLTRFYAYKMCSPTRSSLQSGRLPIHVNIVNKNAYVYNETESTGTGAGIPRNMTGIAHKLRASGYRTHMAGKWDAGMATMDHTPKGKGYESSLCYFQHANNYWYETTYRCGDLPYVPVDFWDHDQPAKGLNGTKFEYKDGRNIGGFEDYILSQRLISIIEKHDPAEPLFMFYSAHLVHAPYMIPQQYLDKMSLFVKNETAEDNVRLLYAAMVNFLDGVVGNLTSALKAKGMWDNTLMLFLSDNGGPIYDAASNYPLRGGKYSEFEGGVRVASFVSGGLLHKSVRGTTNGGLGSVADIYTTFCGLAGVDSRDHFAEKAGLPAVDGVDLSDMLLLGHASPRAELPLSPLDAADLKTWDAYDAFINGSALLPDWAGLWVQEHGKKEEVDNHGWCKQWQKLDGVKKPQVNSAEACWQVCRDHEHCMQAVFESAGPWGVQCFIGSSNMTLRPQKSRSCDGCVDRCYAKYGFQDGPAPSPSPTPSPPSPSPTPKRPMCWKVQACDFLDEDLKVKKGVQMNDCCKLCNETIGCAASVFEPQSDVESTGNPSGTCRLKRSAKKQIVHRDSKKVCWMPGIGPMPTPITARQAGVIVGDLKLVTGTAINMAVYSGPFFPNASTYWIMNQSIEVPHFDCSTPYKIGCLFNVSADPTEQNDLALSHPDVAKQLLDRLRFWSATRFDPYRGDDPDPRACHQVELNGGFYGPFAP